MKHCTYLGSNSGSIFLKQIAQTVLISPLFPEYTLTWDFPIETDHLLLLNTSVIAMHFSNYQKHLKWVREVTTLEVMPGTAPYWKKLIDREVEEIQL